MRSKKQHVKADQLLLGYSIEWIHPVMDEAVKTLGAGHRIVKHGVKTLDFIEGMARLFYGDEWAQKARKVALLHILLDSHIIDDEWVEKKIRS